MSGLWFICKDPLPSNAIVGADRGIIALNVVSAERGDEFTNDLKSQKSMAVEMSIVRKTTIGEPKRQHDDDQGSTSKMSPRPRWFRFLF